MLPRDQITSFYLTDVVAFPAFQNFDLRFRFFILIFVPRRWDTMAHPQVAHEPQILWLIG